MNQETIPAISSNMFFEEGNVIDFDAMGYTTNINQLILEVLMLKSLNEVGMNENSLDNPW